MIAIISIFAVLFVVMYRRAVYISPDNMEVILGSFIITIIFFLADGCTDKHWWTLIIGSVSFFFISAFRYTNRNIESLSEILMSAGALVLSVIGVSLKFF